MDDVKQTAPETETQEEYVEYVEEYEEEYTGPSGFSLALNRWFHHLDRGGSLGGEILAGISLCFLSVCVIFMNMQIVGNAMTADVVLNSSPMSPVNIAAAKVYAQLYAGSILVAIIGSLLAGIVARLPFTQVSSMGFASSLLCLVGTQTGLTWQNLLFLNLVAALLYGVICGVPKIRELVFRAVPQDIRQVLPAALGLMTAWYALQMTGLVTTKTLSLGNSQGLTLISGFALTGLRKLAVYGILGGAVALILYVVLCLTKRKHKVFWPLLAGTGVFLLLSIVLEGLDTAKTESIMNFGRLWLVAGSQASQQTPFADSYLTYGVDAVKAVFASFGQVFTQGTDFSAYTGNTLALLVSGVLCYLFSGIFQTQAALLGAQVDLNATAEENAKLDFTRESGARTALLCTAVSNLLAPFFGVAGVNFGVSSVAGARDRGKSGITSLVACIGFVISLFVMALPALFATVTHPVSSMNEWNYFAYGNGGIIYLIRGTVFTVADVVLMCVGVSMAAAAFRQVCWKNAAGAVSAVVTVLASLLTLNLVAGVLLGCLVWLLLQLICDRKAITLSTVALTVVMAVTVMLL